MSMKKEWRMTLQTLQVLQVFLREPNSEHCGIEIIQATRLASGTVYPILRKLEADSFLTSYREKGKPQDLKRPLKQYYKITAKGKTKAEEAFLLLFS